MRCAVTIIIVTRDLLALLGRCQPLSTQGIQLKARESNKMLPGVGRRDPRERAGNTSAPAKFQRLRSLSHKEPEAAGSSPLDRAGFLRSRLVGSKPHHKVISLLIILLHTFPCLWFPSLCLFNPTQPFKACLMQGRISNGKSLSADGPGF